MYYKVLKNGKVIDALDKLIFLKHHKKYNRMILSNEEEAQAFLSSDERYAWHEKSLRPIPVEGYDTVEIEKIDVYEYEKLRRLNMKTEQDIIDDFVLSLFESGVL